MNTLAENPRNTTESIFLIWKCKASGRCSRQVSRLFFQLHKNFQFLTLPSSAVTPVNTWCIISRLWLIQIVVQWMGVKRQSLSWFHIMWAILAWVLQIIPGNYHQKKIYRGGKGSDEIERNTREGGAIWDEFPPIYLWFCLIFSALPARKSCGSNECDCPQTLPSVDIISGNIHTSGAHKTWRDLNQDWN